MQMRKCYSVPTDKADEYSVPFDRMKYPATHTTSPVVRVGSSRSMRAHVCAAGGIADTVKLRILRAALLHLSPLRDAYHLVLLV